MIFGVDPGPRQSAIVLWNGSVVVEAADVVNHDVTAWLNERSLYSVDVAIEWIESFGMAVGREVFETVFSIGSMSTELTRLPRLIPRRDVKLHLCGSSRAKDTNIRQAIIDRFGVAGTKKNPGPLFGVAGHRWSALAVAVTAWDVATTEHEATFHKEVVA